MAVFWTGFLGCTLLLIYSADCLLIPNRHGSFPTKTTTFDDLPALTWNDMADLSLLLEDGSFDGIRPDVLEVMLQQYRLTKESRRLGHFSWATCGGPTTPFQITNLTLSPDPIQLGSPVHVTGSGSISTDLGTPLEVEVTVQKKIFVWVTLPCVDGMGSCTYPDLCSMLPPPPCPQPLIEAKLPCSCPFPAGTYAVNDLQVEFTSKKYPAWLTEGDFKAHVVVKKGDQSIACYDVELNIVS